MNQTLKDLAYSGKPKLENLSEQEVKLHKVGLLILAGAVSEDFLDLPKLVDTSLRHNEDGLFYSIPYLDDTTLGWSGTARTLMVVWKIENRNSFCPLRIEADIKDRNNYSIFVYDQSSERTQKYSLLTSQGGTYFTEIKGYGSRTLSSLLKLGDE